MMNNKYKGLLPLLLLWLFMCACSNTKHLPAGDTLYIGSKVVFKDKLTSKKERNVLTTDLVALVRPKPNSKMLGMRLKLYLYNLAGDTKKKGIRHWLRYKIGEPPVLSSSIKLEMNSALLVNMLQNRGFFLATVFAKMDTLHKKKTKAEFDVTTGTQYKINKAVFNRGDSSQIAFEIDSAFSGTLLRGGAAYNLDIIVAERMRIDRILKELGYYYFKPEYLMVTADSALGNNKVNMYVHLKTKEMPEEANNKYMLNDIYVYADYKLHGSIEDTSKANKIMVDNYYIIDTKKEFKPFVIADAMVFEKMDAYSLDDQNSSLSRLVNLGTFKFVKNRFEPYGASQLDVYYYLTPFPKKVLKLEVGALTQNDNRLGTQGSINWRHRNIFKGAENLVIKLTGGFEAQSTGAVPQPGIFNIAAETDLSFARFIVPFFDIQTLSRYLPRSIIKLKYNYETETDRLTIQSYGASFGYDWKKGAHNEHQFYPLNFTYVHTDTLGSVAELSLIYRSLVFNGIILGPTYEYTYNSQTGALDKSSYYFDGLIDLSGNILGLAEGANINSKPKELFGVTYAQYIKLQPDFRYYKRLSGIGVLASRIMMGISYPYGNSAQLPNIKQFWAGGNSDLRGFPSRLVGPGTFNEYSQFQTNSYIQTLGDLKLEVNTELRQTIYKFIELGLFADAGNIWLFHKNPAFPGGEFSSAFYKQLAADVGLGFRLDFKILLLRLDFGFPVVEPWDPQFNIFHQNSESLKDMVLNFAIGYPF